MSSLVIISGATLRVDGAAPNVRMHVPLTEGPGTEPFDGFHRYEPPKVLGGE